MFEIETINYHLSEKLIQIIIIILIITITVISITTIMITNKNKYYCIKNKRLIVKKTWSRQKRIYDGGDSLSSIDKEILLC